MAHELASGRVCFRSILDVLPDSYVALTPVRDEAGHITDFTFTDISDAGCAYLGRSRDTVVGRSLLGLLPATESLGLMDAYRRTLDTGEPLELRDFHYPDHELRRATIRFDIRAIRDGTMLLLAWRDVTELNTLLEAQAEAERRYRLLAEHSGDIIVLLRNDVIEWVSPALTDQLGWDRDDWVGRHIHDFFHPDDLDTHAAVHDRAERGEHVTFRVRMQTRAPGTLWVEVHSAPFADADGRQEGMVQSLRVIEREVTAVETLERRVRATHLQAVMLKAWGPEGAHAERRNPGLQTAVLLGGFDQFDDLAARPGRLAAEEAMQAVTDRITARLRAEDAFTPCGDDQVVVLLQDVHDLRDALNLAEDLRFAVNEPLVIGGADVPISLTIGVTLTQRGESIDDLISRADGAMLRARRTGHNQVVSIME